MLKKPHLKNLYIFRPSGGTKYHLRAMTSDWLWSPARREIAAWLAGWSAHKDLIIFGASGGHMLETAWLNGFEKIEAFDLDPLAAYFFSKRHRRIPFHSRNLFFKDGKLSLEPLRTIFGENPRASFLFSNIIGQIPLEGKVTDHEWQDFLVQLRAELAGKNWASVHDLWTFEPLSLEKHAQTFAAAENGLEACATHLEEKTEVIDHLTGGSWVKGLKRQRFSWSLTQKSLHILEGVHS